MKRRCVGLSEKFDASALIFRELLGLSWCDLSYDARVNLSKGEVRQLILERYDEYEQVVLANNELDVRLYEYVVITI